MENLSHIFISDNYLSTLTEEIKLNKDKLYKHLINLNISNYIDKAKVKSYFNSEIYTLEEPIKKIENKYIFAQLISIRNIAISKEEAKYKEYDNLDVIEDEDNDIDDNKYLQRNDEKNIKTSKIYYKIGFTTTGDDLFYGFEYNQFSQEIHDKLANLNTPVLLKVLLGPNIEVRRGIFYLDNNNFKILS